MKKFLFAFLFFVLLFSIHHSQVFAQTSPSFNAAEIESQLQKLNVLGSVLYIAAHPDDENTRLLAYLANEKHYRTGYLSLTRGDGGQNLIGDEQGEELGLIRTQELLAARRVDGAEQFFTRAYDFGYTKNPEETFQFWDKETLLGDVVYIIRYFRPDVIIMRFPTTGEGGHGQHTASAILAEEAFTAAADAKRFPADQYGNVWQAKRLLWNTFNFGSSNTTSEDQFKIDVGVYDPLLGKSIGEIAAISRSNHKSQGFGAAKVRGSQLEYFKTILGDNPKTDLMDGVNTSWSRVANSKSIQQLADKIILNYKPTNPSESVPALIKLYSAMNQLDDSYWVKEKQRAIENLIVSCSGLWFEAYPTEKIYAHDSLTWKISMICRSKIPVTLHSMKFQSFDTSINKNLGENTIFNYQHSQIITDGPLTQPYWLLQPRTTAMYHIPYRKLLTYADQPNFYSVDFTFQIFSDTFHFARPLQYKYTDPVKGEIYAPIVMAPPVMATIESPVYVYNNYISKPVKVKVESAIDDAQVVVSLKAPAGWHVSPEAIELNLQQKGDENSVIFYVSTPDIALQSSEDTLHAVAEWNGNEYHTGKKTISYDHIPSVCYFPPSEAKLVTVNLKSDVKNIGYIKGAGDMIPEVLGQLGFKIKMLTDDELASGNLLQYDAIITGVRAFNTNGQIRNYWPQLMNYVKQGGTLVEQYNTNANLITDQFGPYAFKISSDRVTDETAKVNFLNPADPVLNSPNKITDKDFEGWIQERGLYFISGADTNYRKIFTMNDAGEKPLDGSLIVAKYGQGKFVYTALSFFRELPAGVPGAIRLFVNLISKNE